MVSANGALLYEYAMKDHLGNTRLMFGDRNNDGIITPDLVPELSEVTQENHYYPFGMNMDGVWENTPSVSDNLYQYNGKEWNNDFGLGLNGYGARWYDPAISRWTTVDPLSNNYPSTTPYNYAGNSPVRLMDMDGLAPVDAGDPGFGWNVGVGVGIGTAGFHWNVTASVGGKIGIPNFNIVGFVSGSIYGGSQLGTPVHFSGMQYDGSAGAYATLGEGRGTPRNFYTLNYNTPSPFKNTYDLSVSWGQFVTFNSAINARGDGPRTQAQGLFGFRLGNDFSVSSNNDSRNGFFYWAGSPLGWAAKFKIPSTDAGWTGGISIALGDYEIGFQDFTGDRINRDKGMRGDIYEQTDYHKSFNRASTYFKYQNNIIDSFGAPWLQDLIHGFITRESTYIYENKGQTSNSLAKKWDGA